MKIVIKNTIVFLTSIIFSLLICELSLRYIGRLQKIQKVEKIESGWGWKNSPLRYLQPHSADTQINELGLRGQAFQYNDKDLVVLLLGDSQVEAAASSFSQIPEALLEKELSNKYSKPVKVFSLAASGWGQDQQLLALKQYFKKYRADLVLVWATPVNDFWENAYPDRGTTSQAGNIKPSFRLHDGVLKGPYFEDISYYYHSALLQFIVQILQDQTINQTILESWMRKLPEDNITTSSDSCSNTRELYQDEFFRNLGSLDLTKGYTIVSPEDVPKGRTHFSPQLLPESLISNYQIEITRQLIQKIQSISLENSAEFFVFYPVREDLDDRMKVVHCIKTLDGKYYSYKSDNVALLQKLELKDRLKIIRIQGGDENIVSREDRHLNAIGNGKVAVGLSKVISWREIINTD